MNVPPDDEWVPDEVVVPLEDFIDLHPFRPREVRSVVESYLEQALEAGFDEVRLIHGRGIGVQRETIRSLLAGHPGVAGYHDAPPERGGWGATVVQLQGRGAAEIDAESGPGENDRDR